MSEDRTTLEEQALVNWQNVVLGRPCNLPWGFFAYGDAPPGIGGGTGMFTWFTTHEAMLNFIAQTIPFCPPGPRDIDALTVAIEVKAVLKTIDSNKNPNPDQIEKLNEILKHFSQFEWIGTSESLFNGEQPYPCKVRQCFREASEKSGTGPILDDELEEFNEFLDTWGI